MAPGTMQKVQSLFAILVAALLFSTASAHGSSMRFVDTEGDLVEVKSEGGMLNVYSNNGLALPGVEWTKVSGLNVVFGTGQDQADTTLTDYAHLEELNALVLEHNVRQSEAIHHQQSGVAAAPSSTDSNWVEWEDTDGDLASLRAESNDLNLYSNGELVRPRVTVMDLDPDGVTMRFVTANGAGATSSARKEVEAQKALAFFKAHLASKMAAASPQPSELASVDWKDTEGDVVSLRAEGEQLNLYGNGQLVYQDVRLMEVDPDGVNARFKTSAGNAAESTFLSEGEAKKVLAFFKSRLTRHVAQKQAPAEINAWRAHRQVMHAMVTEAVEKPQTQVDGARGDGVKRRPPELIIYAEGDPMAPGYKDPSEPVWQFSHHHVLHLGRHTFAQSVLPPAGSPVEHWIVLFCYNWWEPCQKIAEPYSAWAEEWEARLNQDLFTKHVRFAKVDCATDKELCNAQGVEGYPHLTHYAKGAAVAKWTGGRNSDGARVQKWLNKQLGAHEQKPGVLSKEAQKESPTDVHGVVRERGINILLVLGVLALNFRAVCLNTGLWKGPPATTTAHPVAVPEVMVTPSLAVPADVLPAEWSRRGSMEL